METQRLSKAEYLRRYLSGPPAAEPAQPRRRRKKKPPGGAGRAGMRIVDDDVSWSSIAAAQEKEEEEDEADLPVVAEFIDERPSEVKLMEEFRTTNKWKLLGDQKEDSHGLDTAPSAMSRQRHDSPDSLAPGRLRHDSPDLSPPQRQRHDSPDLSPPRRKRHDSPDLSPPRRQRHDSPDLSPPWRQRHDSPDAPPKRASSALGPKGCKPSEKQPSGMVWGAQPQSLPSLSDKTSSRQKRRETPDLSPPRRKRQDSHPDSPPQRKRPGSPAPKKPSRARGASPATKKPRAVPSPQWCPRPSSQSPSPRRGARDGAGVDPQRGAPQRRRSRSADSDLSPPRRALPGKDRRRSRSPLELSPRRHCDAKGSPNKVSAVSSGVRAGLVSADVLRREQQELKKQEKSSKHLAEESRHSKTVYRDKMGRRRDLEQEQLEQRQKAEAEAERDEQYARWGKGLAQGRQQQQNIKDALKEMQKPLARYIDDQDLDQMLREQEREGDPMANFIKKRKAKESKEKKEKPRYQGPAPPPNRFNIWPGHRWDGVDRSSGFEQRYFARIANKKAVQELAYKWSVEDM